VPAPSATFFLLQPLTVLMRQTRQMVLMGYLFLVEDKPEASSASNFFMITYITPPYYIKLVH
jgi:hypothetical protein